LPGNATLPWQSLVYGPVSDVDEARDIYLLAGDMDLTLIERELVAAKATAALRAGVRDFLAEATQYVDYARDFRCDGSISSRGAMASRSRQA